LGSVGIGGNAPITCSNYDQYETEDIEATIEQINEVASLGCDIIRVAAPSIEAVRALKAIKEAINIPLIADIHFNSELAIGAIESGADGIRINPGNFQRNN